MILKAYSVRDKQVEAFMPPFWARSHGEAIRSFSQACSDPNHQFSKNSGDFDLYYLFDFDDQNGSPVGESFSATRIHSGLQVAGDMN